MSKRRLIFLIDGTSNRAISPENKTPSNLFRLNRAITYGFSGVPQVVFYFSGVATRSDPLSAITGRGFDDILMEAYANLSSNFWGDDAIYIFGFSRGAAIARALSGMITYPGLLWGDRLSSFPEIWKYFMRDRSLSEGERERLREGFSAEVVRPNVSFLGVFDTVTGTSWDKARLWTKTRFNNLVLDRSVSCAVQILAIDDNRNPSFSPLTWSGRSGENTNQVLEQIWMPGVHADIGGSSDSRLLGSISLLTMLDRVRRYTDIELDEDYIQSLRDDMWQMANLSVSDERPGLARKFLRQGAREIIDQDGTTFVHPILDRLRGKSFNIRTRQAEYQATNCPEGLPSVDLTEMSFFDDVLRLKLATS